MSAFSVLGAVGGALGPAVPRGSEPPAPQPARYEPAWADAERRHPCGCGTRLAPSEVRAHLASCAILRDGVDRLRRRWLQRPNWMREAACRGRDVDDFYREETSRARNPRSPLAAGQGAAVHSAKAICVRCPVRRQCLDYAWDMEARAKALRGATEDDSEPGVYRAGIWGGLTPEERSRLADNPKRQWHAARHLARQRKELL